MTRDNVYKEIDRERAYQATLDHTRTDGCAKTVGDYINLLGYYADRARAEWTEHAGTFTAREMIRKLAACAVACLENHECPPRISLITGKPFQLQPGDQASRQSDERAILEWLQAKGGLGLDVHERIGKVLSRPSAGMALREDVVKQLVAIAAEFDKPSPAERDPVKDYDGPLRPHDAPLQRVEKSTETGLEPNFNVGIDAPPKA